MDVAVAIVDRLRRGEERSALAFGCALSATVVATTIAAALAAAAPTDEPTWNTVARATMVGAPMLAGLYAARVEGHERFGVLLYVTGIAVFLTTLGETGDDTLYTLGRAAGWGAEI